MRIAVIGTGRMGKGFATALSPMHDVVIGSRDPDRAAAIAKRTGAGTGVASGEAAAGADAVILAVPWKAIDEVLAELGELRGVVVVDVTNPVNQRERDALKGTSAAERIQARVPKARVCKAWNHVHAPHLTDPAVDAVASSVLIAGDDAKAKAVVSGIAQDIGFDPVDVGLLRAARDLERLIGVMTFVKLGRFRILPRS